MNKRATPALTLHQRDTKEWTERVMNMTVVGLYAYLDDHHMAVLYGLEHCWYIVGEGTTMRRESDGRSPVEPVVPGD
jgi:hypothetical protein